VKKIFLSVIPSVSFFLQLAFLIFSGIYRFNYYVEGDGLEYCLMTESFYRHGTPEFYLSDALSFRNAFSEKEWNDFYKKDYFESDYLKSEKYLPQEKYYYFGGYVKTSDGRNFCYHFWGYSLFVTPFRYLTSWFSWNPLWAFIMANIFFVTLFLIVLWFFSELSLWFKWVFSVCLLFPVFYWYISWEHTEIYMASFCAISLLFFHQKRYALSMLFSVLAAWQNQTFLIFPFFMSLWLLLKREMDIRMLIKFTIIGFIGVLPSLFYYTLYGDFSLIPKMGHFVPEMATWNRYIGFFYDWNQGMILGIPFIMLMLPFVIIRYIFSFIRERRVEFHVIPFLSVLVMTYVFIRMKNWSPGESVVHRYVVWCIPLVAWFVLMEVEKISWYPEIMKRIFMFIFFFMQYYTFSLHQKYEKYDWCGSTMMPIAKWMLNNYPDLYNPDPVIFSQRAIGGYSIDSKIVLFFDKVMFQKDKKDTFLFFGIDTNDVKKLSEIKDYYGWIYLPAKLSKKISDTLTYIYIESKVKNIISGIPSNKEWWNKIQMISAEEKVPPEVIMERQARYLVEQELRSE